LPVNTKYIAAFEPEEYYHIIAKAAGTECLFKTDANRTFFLQKYARYFSLYIDTYAYILLNNHVHWLIKCKSLELLCAGLTAQSPELLKSHQKKLLAGEISFEQAVEFQFKDYFISYAMAFNKENKRCGSLFISPFRRIRIANNSHFMQLMMYIHGNVVKHYQSNNFSEYRWSSYQAILSDQPTLLKRDDVLEWFGGRERFIQTHLENIRYFYGHPLSME